MLDPAHGRFDHVVAMDSLIHYPAADIVRALATLAARTERSIVFTVAPKTPLLGAMHAVGKLFPLGDRSPAIEPISESELRRRVAMEPALAAWSFGRVSRVSRGFYISQAMELVRP
jgi:magnesium-protoporphyrin O-methyltransferase